MTTTADTTHSDDRQAFEAYVNDAPEATFYHTAAWRDAVHECFGHEPYDLVARRDGRIVGALPLTLVRSWIAGRLLVSVPYAVYGGALVDDDEAAAALLERLKDLAGRLDVRCVDLRSDRATLPELPTVDRYVTFRKRLPDRVEDVLPSLPRKARAAARNGRNKHKLEVDFGDHLLPTVWHLYARSMRRLGSPNYPRRFFDALLARTPGKHLVSLVTHQGEPAAGLVTFLFRDTVLPYFSGCDETRDRFGINNVLYLSLMEWAVENRYPVFDFGRSREANRGAYDFKRHQGFEPRPLEYQIYVPPGKDTPNLTPGSGKFALAQRLYRKLPLWATKRLGGWLARAIPG